MDNNLVNSELNADSIIVAHSLETHFTPKYLSDRNISIKLFISTAGFFNNLSGRDDLKPIVEQFKPSDEQIDNATCLMKNRYSIYIDNDHMNPQEELEYYADRFNSEKIFIPNVGHLGARSGIKELPQALEIIQSVMCEKKTKK